MYQLKDDEFISKKGYYCKFIRPDIKIHVILGRIKQKNDGRYEYWRFKDKNNFHKEWNEKIENKINQGVSITYEEAYEKLFEVLT